MIRKERKKRKKESADIWGILLGEKDIIIIINLLLLSATSDPRQITGNMSVAEMPLALYNNLLRNT